MPKAKQPTTPPSSPVQSGGVVKKAQTAKASKVASSQIARVSSSLPPRNATGDGLITDIAEYIYAQAPRPVREVALVAALGVLAGMVGRTYNILGSGLQDYFLLVGKSGIGKQSLVTGPTRLFNVVRSVAPAVDQYSGVLPSAILHLHQQIAQQPVFLINAGDIRPFLYNTQAVNAVVINTLVDLYPKGSTDVHATRHRGDLYTTQAPAVSVMGEIEPDQLYARTIQQQWPQFLARFLPIEYKGERPPLNTAAVPLPSNDLVMKMAEVVQIASMGEIGQPVGMTDEAAELLDVFDKALDKLASHPNEVVAALYRRAHFHALRVSALIAVGQNPYDPVIDTDNARWTIELIREAMADVGEHLNIEERFVGRSKLDMQADLIRTTVHFYLNAKWEEVRVHADRDHAFHSAGVVTQSYLQRKIGTKAIMKEPGVAFSTTIKAAIQSLVDKGELHVIPKSELYERFRRKVVAYELPPL